MKIPFFSVMDSFRDNVSDTALEEVVPSSFLGVLVTGGIRRTLEYVIKAVYVFWQRKTPRAKSPTTPRTPSSLFMLYMPNYYERLLS